MNKTVLILLLGMIAVPSLPATGFPADIAIIVSRENPTDDLSFKDLVKIFKLERQHWEGGKKIYLVMQEAGAPEREVILRKIYRMDDQELKRLWLAKIYTEEIAAFPKTLSSSEAVKRFVSQVPNAIGFIDASFVDERVKVLRLDGKLPGEHGYVLSSASSREGSPSPGSR